VPSFNTWRLFTKPKSDYIKYSKYISLKVRKFHNTFLIPRNQTLELKPIIKAYSNLPKYDTDVIALNSDFNNSGSGYAKGLIFFERW
jgi:hypothetical protein